jgi:N-formylmaleamate deformylase
MSVPFTPTETHLAQLASTGAEVRTLQLPGQGIDINVLDYLGHGPTVLALPGITTPAIAFDFVSRWLTPNFRVVTPDIRGRGLSDVGTSWTLEDYALDVEEIIEQMNLDDVILLGHSMGARIAALVAARRRHSYLGTVVVDPPLTGPGRAPYPTPLNVFEEQIREAIEGTTAERVSTWWPRWEARECAIRADWLASCNLEAIRATHRDFEATDFIPIWADVPVPAVFMYGADSLVVTSEGAAECMMANPGSAYVAVPGAGHMVFWDNPSEGRVLLLSALSGIEVT